MKHDSAVWACLDAPVAAFAFFFVDHEDAGFFVLGEGFFWAGFDALGVFAESACECEVEEWHHADVADSGS